MTDTTLSNIEMPDATSSELLAAVLHNLRVQGHERTQVLVPRGDGGKTIDKLRVALSRSRNRHKARNRKIARFTLNHTIYPYTKLDGTRCDAVVLSIKKNRIHRALELVDSMIEKDQLKLGSNNVA